MAHPAAPHSGDGSHPPCRATMARAGSVVTSAPDDRPTDEQDVGTAEAAQVVERRNASRPLGDRRWRYSKGGADEQVSKAPADCAGAPIARSRVGGLIAAEEDVRRM
jgi:hypothetical protein